MTVEELNKLIDEGKILVEDYYNPQAIIDSNTVEKINVKKISGIICNDPYKRIREIASKIDFSETSQMYIVKKEKDKDYKEEEFGISFYEKIPINYTKVNRNTEKPFDLLTLQEFDTITEVKESLEEFTKSGLNIDKTRIILENRDYVDINVLNDIKEKYNIELRYGIDSTYSIDDLEDFIAMRANINYYKKLIDEAELSPFEKLTYAYDLIKSHEYREAENKNESRRIDKIVKTGYIVCAGYSFFLEQLLKEEGIDAMTIYTNVPNEKGFEAHARNLVKIKDEKYGIDGVFALDATFDSARNLIKVIDENGDEKIKVGYEKLESDVVEKYYDNLSLYRCFMVPIRDYQRIFKGEDFPDEQEFMGDIELPTSTPYKKYSCNTRPGFDQVLRAVAKIRLKEGYSKEAAIESIRGIIEINDYLDKENSFELQAATIKNNF